MVVKGNIEQTLDLLDRLYTDITKRGATAGEKLPLLYCKLAMLELCGWIEDSMDEVILSSEARCLTLQESHRYVRALVKQNSTFSYKQFQSMLISIIGMYGVEDVERAVGGTILDPFKAALGDLKTARNNQAHTHTNGMTPHYKAPSWIKARLNPVYVGLRAFARELRRLKF